MQNPVQDCVRNNGIIEDFIPVAKIDVGRQDYALLLITHIDKLKEQICVLFLNREVTDFINDKKLIAIDVFQPLFQAVLQLRLFQFAGSDRGI